MSFNFSFPDLISCIAHVDLMAELLLDFGAFFWLRVQRSLASALSLGNGKSGKASQTRPAKPLSSSVNSPWRAC